MKLVRIDCSLDKAHPGVVYAKITGSEGFIASGTLYYCLDVCKDRDYAMANAQEVLMWMNRNVEFKGMRAY